MAGKFPDHSKPVNLPRYILAGDGLVHLDVKMSLETFDTLQKLANAKEVGVGDILHKAIVLFQESIKAAQDGKAVGVASDPSKLDIVFTGF